MQLTILHYVTLQLEQHGTQAKTRARLGVKRK